MRALPICLLALMLSGCSMLSRSPVEPAQSTATRQLNLSRANRAPPARPQYVFTPMRQSWLVNRSAIWVKYLASPAASNQDSPPNIPTARKRLQINAARMKANAVLLHRCEVTSGTPLLPSGRLPVQRLTSRRNERISVRANRRHPFAV